MGEPSLFRSAQSCAADSRIAVREFHAGAHQPDMELVLFFCSSDYDLEALTEEMNRLFAGVRVVGCTTAGEIGPAGYCERSISGASFPAGASISVAGHLGSLQQFEIGKGQEFARSLLRQLEARAPTAGPDNSFAFLLIDGLSIREEPVARALQNTLGNIPLIGGSAGDGLKFNQTHVFYDGAFRTDSAVLILTTTNYPLKIFKTQHFVSDEERLVVTEADAAQRIVKEINGLPAAEEYARLVGTDMDDLNPRRFAASPVVVVIDGTDYVRSIRNVNADGSLTFYCAIDEGLVFRVARGADLVGSLEHTLDQIREEIGEPQLVLACDCILRNLEISQTGLKEKVGDVFRRNNTVGFSTYGEQYRGVHVNQTLTGIAIGSPREENDV